MKIKVTVTHILTLSRGVKLVESVISDGEDLGTHVRAGGKLFNPELQWLVFTRRSERTEAELELGLGDGYTQCEEADYERYFASAGIPIHDSKIEVIDE
jgi:hypothetical protein